MVAMLHLLTINSSKIEKCINSHKSLDICMLLHTKDSNASDV